MDILTAACALEDNEIIYLSMDFQYQNEYQKDFSTENHFISLIFRNYYTCQLKTEDYIEKWRSRRRLTVRTAGKRLILSANHDVFTNMARSCYNLSEIADGQDMNNLPPHMHHDWDENTIKSVGITFYYWTPPIGKEGHQ